MINCGCSAADTWFYTFNLPNVRIHCLSKWHSSGWTLRPVTHCERFYMYLIMFGHIIMFRSLISCFFHLRHVSISFAACNSLWSIEEGAKVHAVTLTSHPMRGQQLYGTFHRPNLIYSTTSGRQWDFRMTLDMSRLIPRENQAPSNGSAQNILHLL